MHSHLDTPQNGPEIVAVPELHLEKHHITQITHEDCEEVNRLLSELHMEVQPHTKKHTVPQTRPPILFFCSPNPSAAYSFLSQWYLSPFRAPSLTSAHTMLLFTCAEQYMMYSKAVLFHDLASAQKILATPLPPQQREIGRKVRGFKREIWYQWREELVFRGNWWKFTNGCGGEGLKDRLLETGNRELVEASTDGRIWSIGFEEGEAEQRREEWGLNLIGEVLMRVRRELRKWEKRELETQIVESLFSLLRQGDVVEVSRREERKEIPVSAT
jgi:ribA/ribD-fused uncharacterized protein